MHSSPLLSALKSIEFAFLGAILMRTIDGETKHIKLYLRAGRLYEHASGVYPGSVGSLVKVSRLVARGGASSPQLMGKSHRPGSTIHSHMVSAVFPWCFHGSRNES